MDCLILDTKRMIIRQLREEDFQAYFAIESNDEVMRFICGKGRSLAESRERFDRICREYLVEPGLGSWAVCLKGAPALIGTTCLNYIDHTHIRQIGYVLAPQHQGKGLATELSMGLLQYAFEVCGLPEISAVCDPQHWASEKVMQKSGMEYMGRGHFFGCENLHYRIDSAGWFRKKAIKP